MALNSLKYSLKNQFTSIANSGIRASFDKLRDVVSDSFDNASSSKNGEINGVAYRLPSRTNSVEVGEPNSLIFLRNQETERSCPLVSSNTF